MKWRSPQVRVADEPPMSSVTERYVPLNEPEAMPNDPGQSRHEARLQFHAVTKRFDDGTEALRDISFCVGAGELVAVVGPSGCGKSTLLRLASGLAAPTQGGVEVGRASRLCVPGRHLAAMADGPRQRRTSRPTKGRPEG